MCECTCAKTKKDYEELAKALNAVELHFEDLVLAQEPDGPQMWFMSDEAAEDSSPYWLEQDSDGNWSIQE